MKVSLIALPWSIYNRPSAALAALTGYLRRETPHEITPVYDYVRVASDLNPILYNKISLEAYEIGELLYAPFLYPEKLLSVKRHCTGWMEASFPLGPEGTSFTAGFKRFGSGLGRGELLFGRTFRKLKHRLEQLVEETADSDIVGLTTVFGQFFANLAFCQMLKARRPEIQTILGGSTVSGRVGPALMKEYAFIDYVVQGEGELPLKSLIDSIATGKSSSGIAGVLTRDNYSHSPGGAKMWEVADLEALPVPNYDEFERAMAPLGLSWFVPVEGSRGCWWDRTKRTNSPKAICHFCNLNVQWNGYREKSEERITREVAGLTERYGITRLFFLDNIIRSRGVERLASSLESLQKDLEFFYEARANLHPFEILRLRDAGLRMCQFGIEGLSTSFLRRINKGTTFIQNIQVMKTCYELGIFNSANIIIDYPGATQFEIDETHDNIRKYAMCFEPVHPGPFWLGTGGTLDALRHQFPIRNIRNRDFYRIGVPREIYERMVFFDLSFDVVGPRLDWSKIVRLCDDWRALYAFNRQCIHHYLCYFDAGNFLRIYSDQMGRGRMYLLRGIEREIYLDAMEIRTVPELVARFQDRISEFDIRALVEYWKGELLTVREGERILSLAPAHAPEVAVARIRKAGRRSKRVSSDPLALASGQAFEGHQLHNGP